MWEVQVKLYRLSTSVPEGDGQCHIPAALPRERDPAPIVQQAGWLLGQAGLVRKMLPSPGFETQTIQPIVNYSTKCAISAASIINISHKALKFYNKSILNSR
jgi:hypothetical protein